MIIAEKKMVVTCEEPVANLVWGAGCRVNGNERHLHWNDHLQEVARSPCGPFPSGNRAPRLPLCPTGRAFVCVYFFPLICAIRTCVHVFLSSHICIFTLTCKIYLDSQHLETKPFVHLLGLLGKICSANTVSLNCSLIPFLPWSNFSEIEKLI